MLWHTELSVWHNVVAQSVTMRQCDILFCYWAYHCTQHSHSWCLLNQAAIFCSWWCCVCIVLQGRCRSCHTAKGESVTGTAAVNCCIDELQSTPVERGTTMSSGASRHCGTDACLLLPRSASCYVLHRQPHQQCRRHQQSASAWVLTALLVIAVAYTCLSTTQAKSVEQ